MTAAIRIAVVLVGYGVAIFLVLHFIFGIEVWPAALWALITGVVSIIVFVVVMLFVLSDSEL